MIFSNFKNDITSLSAALLAMTETKLDIDWILVQSADKKVKRQESNFFKKAKHEIVSFVVSLFVDTTMLGNVYEEGSPESENLIEAWIVVGRDQSTILKNMVDDSFTPNTGINVNVKVVAVCKKYNLWNLIRFITYVYNYDKKEKNNETVKKRF